MARLTATGTAASTNLGALHARSTAGNRASTATGFIARVRRVLDRLDSGARCTHASPAFGAMSHDEWMRLHLAHAQLHLGFVAV
jgi:hypothetical protein